MSRSVSRRSILAAFGAAALGASLARVAPARADVPAIKRLVVYYTGHGTVYDAWKLPVEGQEVGLAGLSAQQWSPILAPLAPHAKDLLILDGVEMVTADHNRVANEHALGQVHSLTARNIAADLESATGASIDQVVAASTKSLTAFPSLELGVHTGTTHSFNELGSRLPVEDDPLHAFERVFKDFAPGADQEAMKKLREQRKSILDFVRGEIGVTKPRLGKADAAKLDQHLTYVSDLEKRLGVFAECTPFALTAEEKDHHRYFTYGEYGTDPGVGYDNVSDLMVRIMTAALGCDLTRVVSFWRGQPRPEYFGGEPGVDVHQAYAHAVDKDPVAKAMMTKYHQRDAVVFGELVQSLKDASLLDSTLVVWCGELATGNHQFGPAWPVVMAGGLGGHFETGRCLRYPKGTSHSNLLVSIAQAMGLDLDTFGEPEHCTGPLEGLRA